MSTYKVKGLLKGLRYISHIFEEEKEAEMQIGLPTDVKHVAHVGWDGPSTGNPSWMKDFKGTGFQSAPLDSLGEHVDNPEIKWVSEDSKRGKRETNSPGRDDLPQCPRSSRRHASADNNSTDSPKKKDSATKSRHSRRHQPKDSSESGCIKSTQSQQETDGSPPPNLPEAPKKPGRKKSKESVGCSASTRSRSKATASDADPEPINGSIVWNPSSQMSPIHCIHEEDDHGSRANSNGNCFTNGDIVQKNNFHRCADGAESQKTLCSRIVEARSTIA